MNLGLTEAKANHNTFPVFCDLFQMPANPYSVIRLSSYWARAIS